MCGIAAIRKRNSAPVDPDDLRAMLSSIAHRGPDAAGYAVLDRGSLGLGHVRLSILDLAAGDQPIFDVDRDTCIAFNGEVYDHDAIRDDLARRGHRFDTTTDTEVVLHLYGEYGLDFLAHLNGEFSFVLWDGARRRLIAARDPAGVKPLFYRVTPDELLFGSEVKALLSLPRVPRRIDPRYLTSALMGACPADACAFDGVHALPPGSVMVADGAAEPRIERYAPLPLGDTERGLSLYDAAAEVRARLTRAVRRRLRADVPVNVYLSAGLDSTSVLALMVEQGACPTAYHISFPGSDYDESADAAAIARHYGVPFDPIECTMDRLADALPDAVAHIEGAVGNLNSAAKLLLSRHARDRGTKVCLTGEGADEAFAGYAYFKLEAIWRLLEGDGDDVARGRRLLARFQQLEARTEGIHWDRRDRWRRAARPYGYPSHLQTHIDDVGPIAKAMFPTGSLGLTAADAPAGALRRLFPPDELRRLEPLDASRVLAFGALAGYIIPSLGDRVEMANSLECRTPFLDREVLDFACRLPPEVLLDLDRLQGKRVVRRAMDDLLPDVVRRGHKHPLLSPRWRAFAATPRGRELVREHLSVRAVRRAGLFRAPFVAAVTRLWRAAPARSAIAKRLDLAVGAMLSMQILSDVMVQRATWPRRDLADLRFRASAEVGQPRCVASLPLGSR